MRVEFRHAFHEENASFELCVQLCEGVGLGSKPVARLGSSRCHARITNLDAPSRDLQNMEDRRADQSAKKTSDTLTHPRVASVEPPCLGRTHLKKKICICRMFYEVLTECITYLKCRFCGPDIGAFYAYIYIMYIQYMHNRALYTYINPH